MQHAENLQPKAEVHPQLNRPGAALILSVHTDPAPLEKEWRALETFSHNSLHQSFAWCCSWYRTQTHKILIVTGRINGQLQLLLPLSIDCRHGLRVGSFPGDRFNNISSGLFAPGFHPLPEEQNRLAEDLKRVVAPHLDLLVLKAIAPHWRGEAHPLAALPSVAHPNPSFQLPLLESFEQTLSQLNAKRRRKKFRGQVRRMEEAGGYEVYSPTAACEQHALLDLFFRQKAERFRAAGLPDVFQPPKVRAFLHALIDVASGPQDYPLKMHALRLKAGGEGAITATCGLSRKGDHIICQFGAIDESRVADASPGELLFWHLVERACEENAALFDFGMGDQQYKRSWCPIETTHCDIIIAVTLKGRMAALAQRGWTAAKARLKRNKSLYRLLQRIRTQLPQG